MIAAHRAIELGVGQIGGPAPQQGQSLHRIARVRRPLRRKVGVRAAKRGDQGVQDLESLAAVKVHAAGRCRTRPALRRARRHAGRA